MIELRIPATTANLGPGFDSLGTAVSLYAHVSFIDSEQPLEINGCMKEYCNSDNLIYTSYLKAFEIYGILPKNVRIDIKSEIPTSRGLGSSAACVVAGVAGALYMMGMELDKKLLLDLSAKIEGHPDNVAPAIYGGLTASMMFGDHVFTRQFSFNQAINFYAFIPDFKLSTLDARGILPKQVDLKDAVFNISRIPLLLKGLEENDKELIRASMQDMLHQPYRKSLIPGYDRIEAICMENDCHAVYLSGAGPTIMCLSDQEEIETRLSQVLSALNHRWAIRKLVIDNDGTKILRS
ncbi:MAG TPA: homoserine kinase [Clostridiales bacterium]|nr:homoserine kinase [Clostridiales bacterium]